MESETSELQFNVGGRSVTASALRAAKSERKAAKRPASADALTRVFSRDAAKKSKGFVVVGYSPDAWHQMQAAHKRAAEKREASTAPPPTLDEFVQHWTRANKPTRVRHTPYELAAAADLCADLARKAGWQFVRVDELLKG